MARSFVSSWPVCELALLLPLFSLTLRDLQFLVAALASEVVFSPCGEFVFCGDGERVLRAASPVCRCFPRFFSKLIAAISDLEVFKGRTLELLSEMTIPEQFHSLAAGASSDAPGASLCPIPLCQTKMLALLGSGGRLAHKPLGGPKPSLTCAVAGRRRSLAGSE